jgi:hypothetical protein
MQYRLHPAQLQAAWRPPVGWWLRASPGPGASNQHKPAGWHPPVAIGASSVVKSRAMSMMHVSDQAPSTGADLTWPSCSFRIRLCTLPRKLTIFRVGYLFSSWACRRSAAEPITAPSGSSSSELYFTEMNLHGHIHSVLQPGQYGTAPLPSGAATAAKQPTFGSTEVHKSLERAAHASRVSSRGRLHGSTVPSGR